MASNAAELTQLREADGELTVLGSSGPPDVHTKADIVAITTEDDFLLELGAVLGAQAAVHPVDSPATALDHIGASQRASILVFDTRGMADLRDSVGRTFARVADAIILLFADAADVDAMRQAFDGSRVFAVLSIPVDPDKTALVFAEALAAALAKYSASPAPTATSIVAPKSIRRSRAIRFALGAGVGFLVLAAFFWFIRRAPQHSVPDTARSQMSNATVRIPLAQGRVDELLEKARIAMGARRYTEPADDSALLYYRSAQAADPSSAEAQDGLARVAAVLITRFEDELRQANFDAAALTLTNFKNAAPQDPRSAALESRLTVAKARAELNARRDEQERQKHLAQAAAQSAREEEAAQRKVRERTAALAAKAAQESAEFARAREAEAAASQSDGAAPTTTAHAAPVELKLAHYVTPEYPAAALEHNVSGSVTVAFTVDVKGATRDVHVLSSEPARIFDRGAVEAVKRWRYAPVMVDNAAVEVPTRAVIKFKPQ